MLNFTEFFREFQNSISGEPTCYKGILIDEILLDLVQSMCNFAE